jgi:SET domain-containing protein
MATESNLSPKAESVNGDTIEVKRDSSEDGDRDGDFGSTRAGLIKDEPPGSATSSPSLLPQKVKMSRSSSSSTVKSRATSASSIDKKEVGDRLDETLIKMEPLHPSKPSRSASQKAIPRAAPLFDHLEDATMEAKRSFAVLDICTYANKFLGYTEHAMECDCNEEWGKSTTCTVGRAGSMASKTNMFYLDSASKRNTACGEDSDCINRATKMECVGDCGCGSGCQNQRFQQRQYANVSVIKTEKKGYGLRTNSDLRSGDFLFEYIGEVINEPQFRRRMVQYDKEGIKHFYFMSLSKGEFVDATKKGNLGRFCNHSCSPNCYVDKWVVGDKLRMGIFAERKIKAGEELVFNYNVDRYGANPQPCYCGEPNCTGFIGGKTQTERATKLSAATIEALGIDDGDSWDTAVAKKPRKKKAGEEDEDYVESMEAKTLDTDGVTKVMAALMQCKEKWIAVKLLQRVQRCDDEQVRNRVVKMHGYQILNSQLAAWKEDVNVVLQILDILDKFPRLTRNKIVDSKIESTLHPFTTNEDERVSSQSITLLDQWSKLEVAYRIPRKKRDPNEGATPQKQESRYERRESAHERKRSRSRSQSRTPPRGPSTSSAPSGPRSSLPQRNSNYFPPRPPPFHRPVAALPRGWFQAADNGKTYYYSADGQTTWTRPTQPAAQPPPPPKQPSSQDVLKSIIDNIVSAKEKERDVKNTTPETPQPQTKDTKGKKEEKWKSYDEGKKKKLYENTVSAAWCYQ